MLDTDTTGAEPIRDTMRGTRDALNVKRVFGEAYDLDGVTIIPVARVAGGAGGGGGEGAASGDGGEGAASGGGFGTGFGMGVTPLGVYEVRGDTVTWKPSVDVNRVVKGGQTLTAIIAVCLTIILIARR